MKYFVGVEVKGRVTIEVEASTPGEAAYLAEEIAEDMDFGELDFAEFEAINADVEDDDYVEY